MHSVVTYFLCGNKCTFIYLLFIKVHVILGETRGENYEKSSMKMCVKSWMKSDVKSYREHENTSIHKLNNFFLLTGTILAFLDPDLLAEFYPYPIHSKDSKSCGFHYIPYSCSLPESLFCSVVEMSAEMGSQLQRVSPKPQGHISHTANPVVGWGQCSGTETFVGSGSGSDFWQVTVFQNIFGKNLAFLQSKFFYKEKIDKFRQIYCKMCIKKC